MLKVILLSAIILAIGIAGMAVTIIVKKDGKFPDGEISHSKELRRQGVICAKEEEMKIWRKRHHSKKEIPHDCPEGGCEGCSFFEEEK